MEFECKEIGLSAAQAAQIQSIRYRFDHTSSSHAFNTLYIWRRFVGDRLHLQSDMFTLRYSAKGENTWLFPCGDREAAYRFIQSHRDEPAFSLCYCSSKDVEWLQERFPGCFLIQPSPGDSEYIISREGHLALTGKRYEKLRNKAKRAERDHLIVTERLTSANVDQALAVIGAWRGNRPAGGALDMYGDEEDFEPLTEMKELGLTGILMHVDGVPFGVAAGFMLSHDTFDLFLAKECVKDPCLGYYMRRELMRMLPSSVAWVNLQDDLDIEGLRTMKKQMIPDKMNEMWTAKRYDETENT